MNYLFLKLGFKTKTLKSAVIQQTTSPAYGNDTWISLSTSDVNSSQFVQYLLCWNTHMAKKEIWRFQGCDVVLCGNQGKLQFVISQGNKLFDEKTIFWQVNIALRLMSYGINKLVISFHQT